jgi:ABC-type dipeptide/oligopeptide/nickel transport system permease subunit
MCIRDREGAAPAIETTARSTAATLAAQPSLPARRGSGPSLFRRLLGSAKGLTGAILVGLAIVAAITAPLISPHDPAEQRVSGKFAKPWLTDRSSPYFFGGDNLGRDIMSRTIYGSRASLELGISVTVIAAIVGSILGGIAGFQRGFVDTLIMRLVDFQLSIPFIILALIFLAILGPGFRSVFVALAVALWVNYARLVRAETLKIRETEYVVAASTIGASPLRVLGVHILPNILHSIIVLATLDMAFVIVFESSLTFLGLGIQPPTPTWGFMLSEGHNYLRQSPWMSIVPGAAIVLTVVGINLLGDWLRDTLDPSLRGR